MEAFEMFTRTTIFGKLGPQYHSDGAAHALTSGVTCGQITACESKPQHATFIMPRVDECFLHDVVNAQAVVGIQEGWPNPTTSPVRGVSSSHHWKE